MSYPFVAQLFYDCPCRLFARRVLPSNCLRISGIPVRQAYFVIRFALMPNRKFRHSTVLPSFIFFDYNVSDTKNKAFMNTFKRLA